LLYAYIHISGTLWLSDGSYLLFEFQTDRID